MSSKTIAAPVGFPLLITATLQVTPVCFVTMWHCRSGLHILMWTTWPFFSLSHVWAPVCMLRLSRASLILQGAIHMLLAEPRLCGRNWRCTFIVSAKANWCINPFFKAFWKMSVNWPSWIVLPTCGHFLPNSLYTPGLRTYLKHKLLQIPLFR